MFDAYVGDYLREEIAAEGAVRALPTFSDFLDAAALSDGGIVNYSNIARDCGISGHTVRAYFGILEDTLLGSWLPAYRKQPKRRVIQAPKFYFADVGVVNRLARRGRLERGSEAYGHAFENWVHHELAAFRTYSGYDGALSHWRLAGGTEVDFVLGDMELALEAKASPRISRQHLNGLRSLIRDHPGVGRRVVVSLEPRSRRTDDGVDVLSPKDFVERLWSGDLCRTGHVLDGNATYKPEAGLATGRLSAYSGWGQVLVRSAE